MLELPVHNRQGDQVDTIQIDEQLLGGEVRPGLLKQAIVMYEANRRQGTMGTKSRGMVAGSTRKIYRQKGTGNARMGTIRTPVRRGGGMAFRKDPRDFSKDMPKKMRRLARNNALLAKIQSNGVKVIDELSFETPKTKEFAAVLRSLDINGGCVVTLSQPDSMVWLSGRNLPKTEIRPVSQLNAHDVLRRRHLLMTRAALESLLADAAPAAAKN